MNQIHRALLLAFLNKLSASHLLTGTLQAAKVNQWGYTKVELEDPDNWRVAPCFPSYRGNAYKFEFIPQPDIMIATINWGPSNFYGHVIKINGDDHRPYVYFKINGKYVTVDEL